MNTKPDISSLKVPKTAKNKAAEEFLKARHNRLSAFESFEDFAVNGEESLSKSEYNGLLHHILCLRSDIAKTLWSHEIFVSVTIIDEFVFHESQRSPGGVIQAVLKAFSTTAVHMDGFVLYPLHGFGLELPSMFSSASTLKTFAAFRELGVCVTTQSNDFEEAYRRVCLMSKKLGIKGKIPRSDFEHLTRPSRLRWFESNPLMMVRLASHTGGMYENQFIYTLKIRIAASLYTMLAALAEDRGAIPERLSSSAEVNNFSTLDINHYLIGEATFGASKPLVVRRVPMNVGALELARLSDLSIRLSTDVLERSFMKSAARKLTKSLKSVEEGYRTNVHISGAGSDTGRLYSRIVTALDWFRQSFGARSTDDEAIVSLAVAFETLLADRYRSKPNDRIKRRVRICMKGQTGVSQYADAAYQLMRARGGIVHNGKTMQQADIAKARAAFVRCFIDVSDRLKKLPSGTKNPMDTMLNDPN